MNRITTTLMAVLLCMNLCAQKPDGNPSPQGWNNGPRQEFNPKMYKKFMNEFVTREAKLTDAEASRFFPMLEEMQNKQHELTRQQRELIKQGFSSNLKDADYERIITKVTALDVEIKKVEQNYYKKFHSILTWKKIHAVRMALNRFQMEALKHFQPGDAGRRGRTPRQ